MPVIRAIILSIAAHLLLLAVLNLFADRFVLKQPEVTEITLLPAQEPVPTKPQQQVVRDAFVPDKLKAPDDDTLARFLSAQKQRVKKESQSAQSGMTQNRQGRARNSDDSKPARPRSAPQSVAKDLEEQGFKRWDPAQDLRQLNRTTATDAGASTTGESLPTDVSIGSFTALNTDRFTFYTFYARVEELVRFRWESRVQAAINSLDRAMVISLGGRSWISQVEFLLSPTGELKKAMIMKESGVQRFDMAAINAFREARIFPNPPKEMVQEDGYIHLKFNFTVRYNPSPMVGRD